MKRLLLFYVISFIFVFTLRAEEIAPIDIRADKVEYFTEKNLVKAQGNVKIIYKDVILTCQEAEANTLTKEVVASGNVIVEDKKHQRIAYGKKIIFNMETKEAKMFSSKIEAPPFYGWAHQINKKKGVYELNRGWMTTCDLEKPHYRLSSKRVLIFPKKKVVAYNVIMFVGNIPVFYFPYYIQPLYEKVPQFGLLPGKSSEWGYYVLSWYRYHLNDNVKGKIHFDWREKKGIAQGLDINIKSETLGDFDIRFYHTEDRELESILPYRYRADLRYQFKNDRDTLFITGEFHKFKDRFFLKDFFYREYEKDKFPPSYLYLNNFFNNATLSVWIQKRANHFFTETERLPQVLFSLYNVNLFKNLYYSLDLEGSRFTNKYYNVDTSQKSNRYRIYQKLQYVSYIKGLKISPYLGNEYLFYSHSYDDNDVKCFYFFSGIDSFLPLFKIYHLSDKDVRHIIGPSISFNYIHQPTTDKDRIFKFDEVDSRDYEKDLSFKLKNIVQVKKDGNKWNFLDVDLGFNYLFDGIQKEGFKNLIFDLKLDTPKFLSFSTKNSYSFARHTFTSSTNDITFKFNPDLSFSAGYYYRKDYSKTIITETIFSGLKKWKFSYYNRFNADGSGFEEHQFKITRDLHCWLMDVIIKLDEDNNVSFYIGFKLKAFPKVGFNFETSYHGPGR